MDEIMKILATTIILPLVIIAFSYRLSWVGDIVITPNGEGVVTSYYYHIITPNVIEVRLANGITASYFTKDLTKK